MNRTLIDFYRCPENTANFALVGKLSEKVGFFRFGPDVTCYGQCTSGSPSKLACGGLHDVSAEVRTEGSTVWLPFDPVQVAENLRLERYTGNSNVHMAVIVAKRILLSSYYLMRPLLSVPLRRPFQKIYLRGTRERVFPKWPVDHTVETMHEKLLMLSMTALQIEKVPFIWFWPDSASSCAIITHDVETPKGRDSCAQLMDLDDSFGIKASFQIVPEKRYTVAHSYLEDLRSRGFEINVQDLNHDGRLYSDRERFLRRAKAINLYGKEYGAKGFRAACLYRNADWYDALDFSYDMSIPNVGHMDPQAGGCCTVFPYFIGKILELPVTTTQDYSLVHVMEDSSIDLWKTQIGLIREKHGLTNVIIHPDYSMHGTGYSSYRALLEHLSQIRSEGGVWICLPRDVDAWWRQRSRMKLVCLNGRWRVEGEGKERARVAYARIEGGRLVYSFE